VLDADIREFFTSLDHRWLMKFLEHRIADKRCGCPKSAHGR
jgi:RNA-directed DNA polymerase